VRERRRGSSFSRALSLRTCDVARGAVADCVCVQARTPYEEQTHTAAVRRMYHLAITNPMHGVEDIWRAYDQYERGLNAQLVRDSGARRDSERGKECVCVCLRENTMGGWTMMHAPIGLCEEQGSLHWRARLSVSPSLCRCVCVWVWVC
jgi:hypothetical protein